MTSKENAKVSMRGWTTRAVLALTVALVAVAAAAGAALAAPVWEIEAAHGPRHLAPGGTGQLVVMPKNAGATASSGTTTVQIDLPDGVTATSAEDAMGSWTCSGGGSAHLTCTNDGALTPATPMWFVRGMVTPIFVGLAAAPSGAGGTATAEISGGGAATPARAVDPMPISPEPAGFGFEPGSFSADVLDAASPAGTPIRQAGSHPFELRVGFKANLRLTDTPETGPYTEPDGRLKTLETRMPLGFVGNPQATPKCKPSDLIENGAANRGSCPAAAQVGTIDLMLNNYDQLSGSNANVNMGQDLPVWNMEPARGAVASFGFAILGNPVSIDVTLDPRDHSIVATVPDANATLPIRSATLALWGVPGDPAHDALRLNRNDANGLAAYGTRAGIALKPFLTLPSRCGVDTSTSMRADAWARPGEPTPWLTSTPMQVSGCDDARIDFRPRLGVQPGAREAGAPTSVSVDLVVPQKDDLVPDPADVASLYAGSSSDRAIATPPVRDVRVVLPEGMTVSPSSSAGLAGCTPAQIGLDTNDAPACPAASKIGAVEIETPLLPAPLRGSVYLAQPHDNPSHSLLALYVVASGSNVMLKLPGTIAADPATGRLTTTFADNPQLPFSKLHLEFKDGPRAPLKNPSSCGTFTTEATVTSWDGREARSASSFTIDQGCGAARFAPRLSAGSANPTAGAYTPFSVTVARSDADQELRTIERVELPAGLLARVASVPLCPEANAAAGTCPAASLVGHVQVAAGAGSAPAWIPQAGGAPTGVSLAGPYRGAPFSLSIVVPAQAGPFDLGTVVVRSALAIDPQDAHVTALTDPLPQILEGIPLQIREVRLLLDRAGFTFNPTSCAPKRIAATLVSAQGTRASASTRFQVGDCQARPLSPVIAVSGGGKGNTARFKHPALKVTLTQPAAQAHLDKVNVVLPKAFNVDLTAPALRAACPRELYAQDRCSKTATVGTVKAVTPVFREPLTGTAFLLQKKGRLPDIVMRLSNVHYSIDLIGVLDFLADGRIVTRVKGVPDAPISRFELSIRGGRNGSLLNRADLCARRAVTQATFRGQNGKVSVKQPLTRISGCPSGRAAGGRS